MIVRDMDLIKKQMAIIFEEYAKCDAWGCVVVYGSEKIGIEHADDCTNNLNRRQV